MRREPSPGGLANFEVLPFSSQNISMLVEGRPEGILLGRSSDGGLGQTCHHFQNAPPKWERVIQACKPWFDQLWSSLSILIPETDPRQTSLCTFCRAIWRLVTFVILSLSGFSSNTLGRLSLRTKFSLSNQSLIGVVCFHATSGQSPYNRSSCMFTILSSPFFTFYKHLSQRSSIFWRRPDSMYCFWLTLLPILQLPAPKTCENSPRMLTCVRVCVQQLLFNTKHSYSCVISWQRFTWLPSQKRQVIWELGSLSISQLLLLVPFPHILRIVLSSFSSLLVRGVLQLLVLGARSSSSSNPLFFWEECGKVETAQGGRSRTTQHQLHIMSNSGPMDFC